MTHKGPCCSTPSGMRSGSQLARRGGMHGLQAMHRSLHSNPVLQSQRSTAQAELSGVFMKRQTCQSAQACSGPCLCVPTATMRQPTYSLLARAASW